MFEHELAKQQGLVGAGGMIGPQPMSMTDRLQARKHALEQELRLVVDALDALQGNDEIARAVDAISKLGHF